MFTDNDEEGAFKIEFIMRFLIELYHRPAMYVCHARSLALEHIIVSLPRTMVTTRGTGTTKSDI